MNRIGGAAQKCDSRRGAAEATYCRHRDALRLWSGHFALVIGDRLVGVFRDELTARRIAACAADPLAEVLVRRIDLAPASERVAPPAGPIRVPIGTFGPLTHAAARPARIGVQ